MTATQKLQWAILLRAAELIRRDGDRALDPQKAIADDINRGVTEANVDSLWARLDECDPDFLADLIGERRSDWVAETEVLAPGSRHYESKSVAAKMPDGSWVGWVYWYGGGKHGEPGAVPWMEDAYDLTVTETEKVVTVRTFTKVDAPSAA